MLRSFEYETELDISDLQRRDVDINVDIFSLHLLLSRVSSEGLIVQMLVGAVISASGGGFTQV